MRVGPTMPIVPTVASPAVNGAATIEAPHSPVVGCSSDRDTHVLGGGDVLEHPNHLLLPLEGLHETAQGVATPDLRVVGQIRDPAHDHVPGPLALGRHAEHVGGDQQDVMGPGGLGGRHPQQRCLRVEIRRAANRAQPRLGRRQGLRVDVFRPVDDLLVDTPVLQAQQRRSHVDHLESHQVLVGCAGWNRETRVLGEPRQQVHRAFSTSSGPGSPPRMRGDLATLGILQAGGRGQCRRNGVAGVGGPARRMYAGG